MRWAFWTVGIVALLFWTGLQLLQANAAVVVERLFLTVGYSTVQRGSAELDILDGDLTLGEWKLEAPGKVPGQNSQVALDTLVLQGFSKTAWFVHRRIAADVLVVHLDSVVWRGKSSAVAKERSEAGSEPHGITLGRSSLRIAVLDSRSGDAHVCVGGIVLELSGSSGERAGMLEQLMALRGGMRTGALVLQGREQAPLRIAGMSADIPAHSAALHGITFGADSTVERDATRLEQESDLVTVALDTLVVAGISASPDAEAWSAQRITVSGGRIHVARDKRLPDPAFQYRPLVAGLLRKLPLGGGADTVLLNDVAITYHELAEKGTAFGRLPFHHITGAITGLRHFGDTTSTVVEAEGFLFDSTRVHFHLRTSSSDTTERFTARARVQGMPFADLEPILQPLTDVRPVSGWLSEIRLTMEGDDRVGRGVVSMRYNDLKLAMGDRRDKTVGDALGTAFLNALVRKRPRADADREREGAFTMERRRDRFIFNMLWRSVREGALNIMLPEVAAKQK